MKLLNRLILVAMIATIIAVPTMASSTVEYNVPATYSVDIPAVITVGEEMNMEGYFNIPEGSHVDVFISPESLNIDGGVSLYNASGSSSVTANFYNDEGTKVESGIYLVRFNDEYSISSNFTTEAVVTGEVKAGRYSGTVDFDIVYSEF